MFGPFRKERPFMGWMGYGGGAASLAQKAGGGAPITASGGDKSTSGDYTYHVYGSDEGTGPKTFSVSDGGPWEIDILLAGAGGGGGGFAGGGGGGGGGEIGRASCRERV